MSANSISNGKVVSIHYTLTDDDGEILDSSDGRTPLDYLHGAGNIVPGLESKLAGKQMGERLKVDVAPQDGYGVHDPRGLQRIPRENFPSDIEIEAGMQFSAEDDSGGATTIWVVGVEEGNVLVDLNHPLAGKTLHFDVTIAGIRDATKEETTHGHVHGPGGHHH